MKHILLLLSVLISLSVQAQEKLLIDKVIAKVGTETILLSDVESQYSYTLEQGGEGIAYPKV